MSCSINKLKPHMFFICKNCIFSDFTWKKNFTPEYGGGIGSGGGGRGAGELAHPSARPLSLRPTSHCNTFYFLRYARPRYTKITKQ